MRVKNSCQWWMAGAFAVGSMCFFVGPFPGYGELVGARAQALTFFVGSVFFTIGGALQTLQTAAARHVDVTHKRLWRAALVQSAGTLFFNATTFRALTTTLNNPHYDKIVWRPDALGSICFLVSGAVAYSASERRGWLPAHDDTGWWQPLTNLVGCIFFGIAAVAGYLIPATGSILDQAAANWNTSAGAACFFACALETLRVESRTRS